MISFSFVLFYHILFIWGVYVCMWIIITCNKKLVYWYIWAYMWRPESNIHNQCQSFFLVIHWSRVTLKIKDLWQWVVLLSSLLWRYSLLHSEIELQTGFQTLPSFYLFFWRSKLRFSCLCCWVAYQVTIFLTCLWIYQTNLEY